MLSATGPGIFFFPFHFRYGVKRVTDQDKGPSHLALSLSFRVEKSTFPQANLRVHLRTANNVLLKEKSPQNQVMNCKAVSPWYCEIKPHDN